MSFDRKQLVRKAFNILDATGDGKVSIDDIMQNYDFSKHPSVIGGVINTDGAAEEMLSVFEQGECNLRVYRMRIWSRRATRSKKWLETMLS